jgi:hypothetical protein
VLHTVAHPKNENISYVVQTQKRTLRFEVLHGKMETRRRWRTRFKLDHADCLQERESPEHVLISCLAYETSWAKLKDGLASLSVDFNSTNILGLNCSIPKYT